MMAKLESRPGTPDRLAAWLIPLAGGLWAAWHLRGSYFFYDEWTLIDRVVHATPLEGTLAAFNGHLWMLQYWIYRLQVLGFGVDTHVFVSGVFVCALVALHLSLASLLRASGLSPIMSVLVGGLLTYLGAASQNFVFAVQLSPALSLAACLAASSLVLTREPSPTRAVLVGTLMLLSVGLDSGTALVGLTLASCVTLLAWRGVARLAIAPSLLALGLWIGVADRGPVVPGDLLDQMRFAGALLLRGAGGLIGQAKTVGAFVLVIGLALVALAWRRGCLDAHGRIMLVAGSLATVVLTAALARTRAGIPNINFFDFNRYVQNAAIPMTLAAAPALAALWREWIARGDRATVHPWIRAVPPALVIAAFLTGLSPMRGYVSAFEGYSTGVRSGVASATRVIREGCPSGHAPNPSSQPLGDLSPQITTSLLRTLLDRSLLTPSPAPPDPAIVARMCPAGS